MGRYDRAGRSGIIDGESISLPEQNNVTAENIIGANAPSIQDGSNRSRSLDLTTIEYFDTPSEAQAALVTHELAWAAVGRTGTLAIAGIGSWLAGVQSRTPAIVRHCVLQVSYSIICGKRL